nr:methanogenesis marker 3 protein [Methanophagales archaeon]
MRIRKEMRVKLNGVEREVSGRTLGEILSEAGVEYSEGCAIAIVSERKKEEVAREFILRTPKGDARIKLHAQAESPRTSEGGVEITDFRGEAGRVAWKSEDVVAIGPIKTNLSVSHETHKYEKWDVFLGFGGFDPAQTFLCISKHAHEAAYGAPAGGVIGRLTRGKSIVTKLSEGDAVEIEAVEAGVEKTGFTTTDLNTEVHEGEEIYTHMHIKLFKEAPMSSEHFLSLTRDGVFHVDEATHTFIATTKLRGLNLPEENIAHRLKFTVAARLTGTERGKVFIYRAERLSSPAHNVLGEIIEGAPLAQFAKKGDKISVKTTPKWLMCVGMTQKEAEEFLAAENIQQVREGNKDDDAVVVEQEPEMTMDVLESGTVKTFGVSKESVLPVQLFHKEAPKTVWYFRKVTGMVTKPIGRLKVFFVVPGSVVLFEGKASEAGLLVPENTPKGKVEPGVLGVTNMAKTNRGMMGIRLEESTEYGPTGEALEHTNIVLRISPLTPEIIRTLSRLKEGDVIYVKEVQGQQ